MSSLKEEYSLLTLAVMAYGELTAGDGLCSKDWRNAAHGNRLACLVGTLNDLPDPSVPWVARNSGL